VPPILDPPSKVAFKESHEPSFQEKLVSSRGSNVQMNKNKSTTKGKGKKTIPQEIVELLENVTMVDYEVMTSKKDFNDLLEGTNKRHFSRCLDLSQKLVTHLHFNLILFWSFR